MNKNKEINNCISCHCNERPKAECLERKESSLSHSYGDPRAWCQNHCGFDEDFVADGKIVGVYGKTGSHSRKRGN